MTCHGFRISHVQSRHCQVIVSFMRKSATCISIQFLFFFPPEESTFMRGGGDMEAVFESWTGQPVIMRLSVGCIRLSLRGTVLKERAETLLLRPDNGPDLEINKSAVLAIEEARAHRNDR